MTPMLKKSIPAALAILMTTLLFATGAEAKKALVIGNGTYNKACWGDLGNCVQSDITNAQTSFGDCTWTVTSRKNETLANMRADVQAFCPGAANTEATMFYYTGHGENDNVGRGAPVGIDDDCSRSGNYTAANFAADFKGCNGSYYSYVVADCCGSGGFITDVDAALTGMGLQAILYSATKSALVCADCNNDGSTFTKVFMAGLRGGADANADGKVTADELDAYLTANYDPGRDDDHKHLYIVHGNEGSAIICDNATAVPVEASTWGRVKMLYR